MSETTETTESNKKSLTLTRALADLKTLEDRIKSAYSNKIFVGVTFGTGEHIKVGNTGFTNLTPDELSKLCAANFQSVNDLIEYRTRLKAAIIQANATTTVTVGTETMTIAQALERKKSIKIEEEFIDSLRRHNALTHKSIGENLTNLENVITNSVNQIYSSDRTKIDDAILKGIRTDRESTMMPNLLDPNKLSEFIERKLEEIRTFKTNIDIALSEVNALTKIEV